MHIINQRMSNFFVPHGDAQPDKLVSHRSQGCPLQPCHQFRCPLYPVLSCKGAFYLRPVNFRIDKRAIHIKKYRTRKILSLP